MSTEVVRTVKYNLLKSKNIELPYGDEESESTGTKEGRSVEELAQAFSKYMNEKPEHSMKLSVQKHFRSKVFPHVKFLTDFVINRTAYDGPGYEGGMLHKLLINSKKDKCSLTERIKFWTIYAPVGKETLNLQKANKTSTIRFME